MNRFALSAFIEAGDTAGLREALKKTDRKALNTPDPEGHTPLMRAMVSPRASAETVRDLLAHGARLAQSSGDDKPDVVRLALSAGDPAKVAALSEAGADLCYRTAKGYDALIDAVHGRDVAGDARLIELLKLLLGSGVAMDGCSTYGETALRVLSRLGRFDAVALLLAGGADRSQLKWTALHEAVAFGALSDVHKCANDSLALEEADDWARTPWLLAVVAGDVDKARCLQERGADVFARGLGGATALHLAADSRASDVLRWLLEEGHDVAAADRFGRTPLMAAVEARNAAAVELLLTHGVDVEREYNGGTALSEANTADIVQRLLDAGADPQRISAQGRRALVGLPPESVPGVLASVLEEEFARACTRRFGAANPHEFDEPFLRAMVRSGMSAFGARRAFANADGVEAPVWCAARFGQSLTVLPDGHIVQIGGEHEDFYDPDFCIYNDVFVHDRAGGVRIFGYPRGVFEPTDFHTATLVGDYIYVIGSLGYKDERRYGTTPLFRLDVRDWRFEVVSADANAPGWIHRHRARLISPSEIEVTGGEVLTSAGDKEANTRTFVLDLSRSAWRVA